jgi:predicted small metal-binding protein
MKRLLRCDCGFEVRADDEAELVARVQRHALEAHALPFSRDDVLRLVLRAELAQAGGQEPGSPKGGGDES